MRKKAELAFFRGIQRILVNTQVDIGYMGYQKEVPEGMYVEINAFNIYFLKTNEFEFSEDLDKLYRRMFANKVSMGLQYNLKKPLKNFQKDGAQFIHAKRGRVLLGDEMGLGKTIQIIGVLSAETERYTPVVVITPAHLKYNWFDELGDFWTNKHTYIAFGKTPSPIPPKTKVLIINYQILQYWLKEIDKLDPQWVVIDEAHNFVSTKTATFQIVHKLCEDVGRTALLTGSPIVNYIQDLWGLINLINPHILGGWTHFIHRFDPSSAFDYRKVQQFQKKKNAWGKRIGFREESFSEPEDASKKDLKLLHYILARTVMIRRRKKDVWAELPAICRKVIRLKVSDREFWSAELQLRDQIRQALKENDKRGDGVIDMKSYSRMRRIVGAVKYEAIVEWINEFLAESTGKLVVTGWHKDILYKLHETFKDSYLITGDIDSKKKHMLEKEFQSDKGKRILFGNIKSIGSGVNLTAADTMLFVELPYTGVDLSQVEARIHRLSQKALKVMYVYMIVEYSLEQDILAYISRKQKLAGRVIDNKEVTTIEEIADDTPNVAMFKELLLA